MLEFGMSTKQNSLAQTYLPHARFPGWLGPGVAERLVAYAVENRDRFTPSKTYNLGQSAVRSDARLSERLANLGPFHSMIMDKVMSTLPQAMDRFGIPAFPISRVEMELVAHGDGAHFVRHLDTVTGEDRGNGVRRVTMVYYFHRQPRAFSGGQLRYYSLMGDNHMDFEPENDLMVSFPSWAPHSVERVNCPDDDFAQRRFAIDIWVNG